MSEWKTYRLGDLCDSISNTYRGKAQNVVLINTSDVLEGKCLNHRKEPNKNLKGQFKKTFQQGDILYSEIRPSNKRFAYIDFDATDYIASTKLMVLRANEKIRPLYLYYILQSQVVIDELQMLAESRSGTFPQITFSELSLLTTELPDIDSQDKIINIFKSLDDKIELNRRINANLEAQAQALFRSWFVDFEPFRDGPFVDSELGKIPQGWKVKTLSNLATVIKKGITPSNSETYSHYSIPAYDDAHFPEKQSGETIKSGKYIVYNNSILLSKLNPRIKRLWFIKTAEENAICSTEFIPIQTKDTELISFVFYLIDSDIFYQQALSLVNGATGSHQRFHAEDIMQIPFAWNKDAAIDFAQKANYILQKIEDNIRENQTLSALRDTMLPKLMAGEIAIE